MVELLSKDLINERNRQAQSLPDFKSDRSAHILTYEDVLDAHFCIVDFFSREGYGLGGVGIKEINGLVSTVERQFTGFQGYSVYKSPYEQIATLCFGIIKNHPFYDANKRTAFLCCLLQLHKMGRIITVSEKQFEDVMVEIADDSIAKRSAVKEGVKRGSSHPEIRFLGRYLEKNSRKMRRLNKTIKFRQLRELVERNGFTFINQNKGSIDLVKVENVVKHRFFFRDKVVQTKKTIANIAYHGEGVDVPESTLKYVRQSCGLTEQDGFDGDVLLRDAQPTFQLIRSYRSALQRLAYR